MLNSAEIKDIMTADSGHQSPFALTGEIGDYSSVILSGTLQPFASRLTANLTGRIDEFDLSPLTSYTVKHLGYTLKSGHLTADVTISISKGELDGTNELVLRNLKVSPEDAEKMDDLSSQLKIPLDVALSLLRNKDNIITIKLPIEGDITDPRFELSDIINKALGTAIRKATMAYLKISFQPFGGLITLVQIAGKAARIRLDSVMFEPGSQDLTEPSLDYLKVVARLMKERPAINISLCGKLSGSDITALKEKVMATQKKDMQRAASVPATNVRTAIKEQVPTESLPSISEEQLLIFAKERALAIKSNLVDVQGIDAKRLFICTPEIDKKDNAKPRVDLLI